MSHTTLDRMDFLLEQWRLEHDPRRIFLNCYRLMTGNMLTAIEAGEFHDAGWVRRLLDRFAEYYFIALEQFDQSDPATPAVWRQAHEATLGRELMVMQQLFLGMNAHINYDLALTLYDLLAPEWQQLADEKRRVRRDDHRHVNEVIYRTIDTVQDTVIAPESAAMAVADRLMGRFDEWLLAQLVSSWREQVWQRALDLLAAPDATAREGVRREQEEYALEVGEKILMAG